MADGLTIAGVSKAFGAGEGRLQAVESATLTVPAGSLTAIIGPSGCGKSTLLRMIAGLETPDTGVIALAGETPDTLRRRGRLGMSFQDPDAYEQHMLRRHPRP